MIQTDDYNWRTNVISHSAGEENIYLCNYLISSCLHTLFYFHIDSQIPTSAYGHYFFFDWLKTLRFLFVYPREKQFDDANGVFAYFFFFFPSSKETFFA